MADEFLQKRRLDQIRLLGDQRLLSQYHLLGGHWVGGEQAPIDVTSVPEVWVVRVLQEAEGSQGWVKRHASLGLCNADKEG